MCTIHRDQRFHFMKLHKPVVSAELVRPIRFCQHFCNVIIWKSLMSKFHCLSVFFYDLENHRTQSQFDRHRVTKLVLFEFVNNFVSLFYIAFYIQDMEMLKYVSIRCSGVVRFLTVIFQWHKRVLVTKQATDRNTGLFISPSGISDPCVQ